MPFKLLKVMAALALGLFVGAFAASFILGIVLRLGVGVPMPLIAASPFVGGLVGGALVTREVVA